MRNLFILCILLVGCSRANPDYLTVQGQPDMLSQGTSTDMGNADTDMVTNHSDTDMAGQASTDMAQNQSGDGGVQNDMAQAQDMTPPPPDLTPPQMYTHTDSFCGNTGSTWTDTHPTVTTSDPSTAKAACEACCNYIGSTGCTCTVFSGTDQTGHMYSAYTFTPSFNIADNYYFYYSDVTYAGAAAIASSNPSDRKNGVWYQ